MRNEITIKIRSKQMKDTEEYFGRIYRALALRARKKRDAQTPRVPLNKRYPLHPRLFKYNRLSKYVERSCGAISLITQM